MPLAITKPTVGGDSGSWGSKLNTALDAIVTAINAIDLSALLPLSGGTLTGRLVAKTSTFATVALPSNGTPQIDLDLGQWFSFTAAGAAVFTILHPPAAGQGMGFILELVNGGSAAMNWPSSVKWALGVAPAFTAAGTDVLVFISRDGGATWKATLAIKDAH